MNTGKGDDALTLFRKTLLHIGIVFQETVVGDYTYIAIPSSLLPESEMVFVFTGDGMFKETI